MNSLTLKNLIMTYRPKERYEFKFKMGKKYFCELKNGGHFEFQGQG